MSQEVNVEESGILTEEDDDGDQNKINNQENKDVLENSEINDQHHSFEEQKTEQIEIDKKQEFNEQINDITQENNITSISKQNEDSNDNNFHQDSYNKDSMIQNEENDDDNQINQITIEDKNDHDRIFSKGYQQNTEYTNQIIQVSSSSQNVQFSISKTDEIITKQIESSQSQSQDKQNEYELCDKTKKTNTIEQESYDQISKQKSQSAEIISTYPQQQQEDEEEKAVEKKENVQKSSISESKLDDDNNIKQLEDSTKIEEVQHQVLHSETISYHPISAESQAFEQKSPAQNTEIPQKNSRSKESVMVYHQVDDTMFNMDNKITGNIGDGKSSSASDNGDEIIQGYINDPLNQIPHQLKMLRNKSNDSEEPYSRSGGNGGNFFVSQMYQFQQQQHENAHQSSGGGVVVVGAGGGGSGTNNNDNYSYSSPQVIVHQQNQNSSPDIMEINFSSSNQTNSYGFSKLSVEKISDQNENNQNNSEKVNNVGMTSVDSKQYSGSNSYELNYSIKMMNSQNEPNNIDDSKRNLKQFQHDESLNEEIQKNDNDSLEQKGDIILGQDHATEFTKHLFSSKIEKVDIVSQIKNKQIPKNFSNTKEILNKKVGKSDYYLVEKDNNSNEDKSSQEYQIIEKKISSNKLNEENQQNKNNSEKNQDNQNNNQINKNQESGKENEKDIFADFFSKPITFKSETESCQFTNFDTQSQQFSHTNRNEDAKLYSNLKSEESSGLPMKYKKKEQFSNVININPKQLKDNQDFSDEESKKSNYNKNQYNNKGQNFIQQPNSSISQNDQIVQSNNQKNKIQQLDNPLSLSELNSFSARFQNSSIINSNKVLKNISILHKTIIIFNCILYGFLIPQNPLFIGKNTSLIISVYLFLSAIVTFALKKQFLPDIPILLEIGLGLGNILMKNPNYSQILNLLFFIQFLISVWKLNAISIRIRSITDVITSSFRPNLEILGFFIILILLFNVIFNVFELTNISGEVFSFSSFEYFKFYVLSKFSKNIEFQQYLDKNTENQSKSIIYLSLFAAFICLFFMKIVVESLLSIVQKVSQEQCYEYVGPHYSCGFLAIFKENEKMNQFYSYKILYELVQGIYIIGITFIQWQIESNNKSIQYEIFNRFFVYISLIFIIYEITIDALLSSAQNIFKNSLYVLVLYDINYYPFFAIILFYAVCSHISYFKLLTNNIATLLLDFTIIVLLNYLIYLSYTDCDSQRSIPSLIPMFIMFLFTLPLLKGMILRYSEIFEVEEDEDAILSSLHNDQNKMKNDEQYDEFDEEIDYQGDRIQDTETSTNQGIRANLNSNKYSKQQQFSNSKPFFIFSKGNFIRQSCIKLMNSSLFQSIQSLLMLLIGVKEFFYFLCSAFSISFHNEFIIVVSYWEKFGEPILLTMIILINSMSYGFILNKNSYLRQSLKNFIFFSLCLMIYGIQYLIEKTYFGFLRVIFLIYLLPFGNKKLNDIYSAISHSNKIIYQVLFLFTSILLILEIYVTPYFMDKPDYVLTYIKQLVYLFSVNIFVGGILVQYSKEQLIYQNPNIIWISIKKKIASHKFNFYFISKQNYQSQSTNVFSKFLKWKYHNLTISIIIGTYYLLLFIVGIIEDYFSENKDIQEIFTSSQIKITLIQAFTFFIISYSIIHISVYNLVPFFCSSALNKSLFLQSFFLATLLVIDIFTEIMSEWGLKIQFMIQLPMLLRTKYMLPIVKFNKCIFRQGIVTLVVSMVMVVCLAHYVQNPSLTIIEYLLIIFNIAPNTIVLSSSATWWINIFLILGIYLANGLSTTILLLDIIRKFDLNESAQAKNKYKQMLTIFENIWDKFKVSHNPSLMKASNLKYFLVKFDQAIEEEEQLNEEKTKQKPLKITYLKKITNMRIKINEDECLYYKDLLFSLVKSKFNRSQDNDCNISYGSMTSFNNINISGFSSFIAEDLELSQLSSRRRWKIYNPLKQLLYTSLLFSSWKRFTDIVMTAQDKDVEIIESSQSNSPNKNKNNINNNDNQDIEDEEDSIFFDPNMVPPETIQHQSFNINQ